MQIRVYGEPAPQGSKRAFVRGNRAVVVEQSAKVAPWRQAVSAAAVAARRDDGDQIVDAVAVKIIFFLPRPSSVRRLMPSVKPDIDKLLRSTLDGISDSGLWKDDCLVVQLAASKRYATADVECAPGAIIYIEKAK